MKKYRKVHLRKAKKRRNTNTKSKSRLLRAGSREVKNKLLAINPHCDICGVKGDSKTLQLHHTYCIRWGFPTKLEQCVLLCPNDHSMFHHRWDKYLDEVYRNDHDADFLKIYNVLKKL